MIELPEAVTIAKQMKYELVGKRIIDVTCNDTPLKFIFFNRSPDDFGQILTGQTVQDIFDDGRNWIHIMLGRHALQLGDMGGRILFHKTHKTIPKKHQLLLNFDDGSLLTVSIVLWGFLNIYPREKIEQPSPHKIPPLREEFTFARFQEMLMVPTERDTKSVKAFLISKPGLGGVGNGCTQDILFNAGIHPRRRIIDLHQIEEHMLYNAARVTLIQMITGGGRNSERDLYNQRGGYEAILGSHAVNKPCIQCGTPIEKIQFLGGASYFCPACQV